MATEYDLDTRINLPRLLEYFGVNYLGGAFDYIEPVGGFVNHDETEYNAITWTDSREKPSYSDTISMLPNHADAYYAEPATRGDVRDLFMQLNARITALENA